MACSWCCFSPHTDDSDGEEVEDRSAGSLSYVGLAAYEVLRKKHNRHFHTLWNVTSAKVVDELQQTPTGGFPRQADPEPGHDDWFPQRLCDIMKKTQVFCDVMSLGPPDGLFMEKFKEALGYISDRSITQSDPITIRMMFGNIVGMPVNCNKVIKKLTKDLPANTNIELWVGAWRKGVSWNHAKIIAVDGHYLWTGGHNLWDQHYLKHNPVHDLSMELEGRAAHNAHLFANEQWAFIERIQTTCCGTIVDKLPDGMPLVATTRVTVSEFPKGATIFPPLYDKALVSDHHHQIAKEELVPVICMGRQGTLHWRARPSDDALHAMLESAKTVIRMPLQDLGPVCVPGTKITIPGCLWPKRTLSVLGKVIWEKGVDVEIILSNPGSIPGGLKGTEACYGNGWSCVDVAAEIIKSIQKQFPQAEDSELRQKVQENLRVCFIKDSIGNTWKDGNTIGLHSKHIIIDDQTAYVGSQNLYICDLAEWGVVIDDKAAVEKMMESYWHPLWKYSYTPDDCNVDLVMDGLKIDRDAAETNPFMNLADRRRQQMEMARLQTPIVAIESMDSMYDKSDDDDDDDDDDEELIACGQTEEPKDPGENPDGAFSDEKKE